MPRPKIVRHQIAGQQRRATDHRALVLEVVATIPQAASREAVQKEVLVNRTDDRFDHNQISAMVSRLLTEGLIGRRDDGTLFVTALGFEWLRKADFTRELPAPHTKPTRSKKK
jgi:hypothetical protein